MFGMSTTSRPKTERGRLRRERILRSAEEVFGEMGFAAASIAEITRRAETAQGTLYIYFSSKEQIFRELVLEMGHLTRAEVARAVARAPDRLSAERAGLEAFLRFVERRPGLYRIVEEARFADTEAYHSYFTDFAEAYEAQLRAAQEAGELSPGNPEIRAWALMGIAKTLGERFVLWDEKPRIDEVVEEAFAMIRDGIAP